MWSYCEELMIVLQICLNWNSAFESSCCPSLMQFLWTWIYGVFSHSHMTSPSTLLVWRNSFDVFYQFCCPNVMTIALADLTVIIRNSQISPTWFLFYQSDVPNFVTMTLAEKGLLRFVKITWSCNLTSPVPVSSRCMTSPAPVYLFQPSSLII